jgi:hypothetical protein
MTLQDVVLMLVCFSAVSTLIVSLLMYRDYLTNKLLTTQVHQATAQLMVKLHQQEIILGKIAATFNEMTHLMGNVVDKLDDGAPMLSGQMMFRTLDGKHTASNLEEFLRKIKNTDTPYLSDDEVEQLRKLFGQTDDLDDDNDTFNPEAGRF